MKGVLAALCSILIACGGTEEISQQEYASGVRDICCHKNQQGKGHKYHGNGHGWGHYKCKNQPKHCYEWVKTCKIVCCKEKCKLVCVWIKKKVPCKKDKDGGVPEKDSYVTQPDTYISYPDAGIVDSFKPELDLAQPDMLQEKDNGPPLQQDSQTSKDARTQQDSQFVFDMGNNDCHCRYDITVHSLDSKPVELDLQVPQPDAGVNSNGSSWSGGGTPPEEKTVESENEEVYAGGCSMTGDRENMSSVWLLFASLFILSLLRWNKLRRQGKVARNKGVWHSKLWIITGLLLLVAPHVYGEPTTQQFKLASGSYDYFHTLNGKLSLPNVSLTYHYEKNPLRIIQKPRNILVKKVITDRHNVELTFASKLGSRFELGLAIPFIPYQTGPELSGGGIGDIRATAKLLLLEKEGYYFSLATEWAIPTSNVDYVGELVGFAPRLMLSKAYGPVDLAVNVGMRIRNPEDYIKQQFSMSFGARWEIFNRKEFGLDLISDLHMALDLSTDLAQEQLPVEWLNGMSFNFLRGMSLTFAAGAGLTRGVGIPEYRMMGSLKWNFGKAACKRCKTKIIRQTRIFPFPIPVPTPVLVKLPSIYFDTDSSKIRDSEVEKIKQLAQLLNNFKEITEVRVEGHCDYRASEKYNMSLGKDRAISVINALKEYGVNTKKIRFISYGESTPLSKENTKTDLQLNRRVDLRIVDWD